MDAVRTFLGLSELWSGFAGALLGGSISLLGSWVATGRAFRHQRKLNEEAEKIESAKLTFLAFIKLKELHEEVANRGRQISEMFAAADSHGAGDMEPCAKVMEIVGDDVRPDQITPKELGFLVTAKKTELFDQIFLTQKRVFNVLASSNLYNELRREFFKFAQENSSAANMGSGTQMMNEFSGTSAVIADAKVSQLNNLLGQIMTFLEREASDTWQKLEEFKDAAEDFFGDNYPKLKLEKVDKYGL